MDILNTTTTQNNWSSTRAIITDTGWENQCLTLRNG